MIKKTLKLFLALVLVKSLIWMIITPIFQVPDEPSHFSIVQFISEKGRRPHPRREQVTSKYVLKVAQITNFTWKIQHPVWEGYSSNWRQQINLLDKNLLSSFETNRYQTSLKRHPFYYFLASLVYLPFKKLNFLLGFFALRFFSIIISLVTIFFSYLISQTLYKNKLFSIGLVSLVAFHPLFSFINIGIHYDPLAILISTIFIYLAISFIKTKQKQYLSLSLLTGIVGVLVKPDLIVLPLSTIFLLKKSKLKIILPSIALFIIILSFSPPWISYLITHSNWLSDKLLYSINLNEYAYAARFFINKLINGQIFTSIINYIKQTSAIHWSQVFPWYWGTFGWLEVSMPLFVYRLIKILILISLAGWVKLLISKKSTLKLSKTFKKGLGFLFFFSLFQALIVILNDFKFFTTSNQIYGIQGRYLLPAITAHMLLLFFGLSQLIPQKHHHIFFKLVILSSIIFNLVGLNTLYQYFGWVW